MASDSPDSSFAAKRAELPWLNVLKLLCALMVVHIHVPSSYREYIIPLCDIAVPVFFIISGYFLTDNKGDFDSARIRRSLWKTLKIIIFAQVLYIFLKLFSVYRHGESISETLSNGHNWLEMMIFGSWPHEPLWYLTAFLEAMTIILFISRFKSIRKLRNLFILIAVTLAAQALICYIISVEEVPGKNNFLTHTFLWPALPCIVIGHIIRKTEWKPGIAVMALCAFTLTVTIYMINYYPDIAGGRMHTPSQTVAVALATVVFMIFLRIQRVPHAAWKLAALGRKHSRNIYIVHSACALVILNIIPDFPESIFALAAFAASILVSAVWIMAQRIKDRKFTCSGVA